MRVFRRIAALLALAAAISGCAAPPYDRLDALDGLSQAPISPRFWSRVTGTYTGPIRASTNRGGYEGLSSMDTRLDLFGTTRDPAVVFRMNRGYSTGWTEYGEWKGVFTNIPQKRYGTQGTVIASTHAPNQLLLMLHRDGTATPAGAWLILTFRPTGNVDVDWIGRSGWRGTGELWPVPALLMPD
jgi:hypothetical protein